MKKLFTYGVILTGLIIILMTAGCTGRGDGGDERSLVVFNYGDYIDRETINMFEKETGIRVRYEEYVTPEDMYTKYKSGVINYDLICTSDYMIEKMIREGETLPYDPSSMDYLSNLDEKYMEKCTRFDPDNRYAVPYLLGTVGILYDTEKVKEPVESWGILWDEKYRGEIIMENSMRDAFLVPLKWKGCSLNTKNRKELDAAQKLLIKQKPLVAAYLVDESRDAMISGDASMAVVYSGDATEAMDTNESLDYAVPKEGSNIWFDCWFIPKSCRHKKEAEAFIDFMNREDVAAMNFDYIYYCTPNKAVYDSLDEETREDTTIFPPDEILDRCEVYQYLGKDTEEYYNRLWKELKSR